ncbi:alpha/beta hydrolase family protein [Bacillus marinisedimentorum]|uniref:alpha/beta hydrolase family protein n=1 Tax=Bacillus marinisedimentorum TaxID=1821260 RepID=UPI000871FA1F|nr:alpha/beta hydrolase family protein [Bacillus marinisedimentorum]
MHEFLDKYSVAMTALFFKKSQWFRESVESPGFEDHLNHIEMPSLDIKAEGFYEIEAETLAGKLDPAFHVVKWLGPEYPTLIYHHGNNERPFNYGFATKNTFKSAILAEKDLFNANLISVRAPFHNDGMKAYLEKMRDLSNFTAMLSASVKLMEMLVQYLKSNGCSKVAVAGISLGGWVVNLHRSYYNSADVYLPIFAGAALDDLFLTSYYKKLASDLVKENPDLIRNTLNFEEEYKQIKDDNVFPLLARFDQIIEFDRQKRCYNEKVISVIDKGHITGALASEELRSHLLNHLNS